MSNNINKILGAGSGPQYCNTLDESYNKVGCGDDVSNYVPQGCPVSTSNNVSGMNRFTNIPNSEMSNGNGSVNGNGSLMLNGSGNGNGVMNNMNSESGYPNFFTDEDINDYFKYYIPSTSVVEIIRTPPSNNVNGKFTIIDGTISPSVSESSENPNENVDRFQNNEKKFVIVATEEKTQGTPIYDPNTDKVYIYDQDGSEGEGYYISVGAKFPSLQYYLMAPNGFSLNETKYEDLTLQQSKIIMKVVLEQLKKSIDDLTNSEIALNEAGCDYANANTVNNLKTDNCQDSVKKMSMKLLEYKKNIKKAEEAVEMVNEKELQRGNNIAGNNLGSYYNNIFNSNQDPYVYFYIEHDNRNNLYGNNLYRNNTNNLYNNYTSYYYALFAILFLFLVMVFFLSVKK